MEFPKAVSTSCCGVHDDTRGGACDLVITLIELVDGLECMDNMSLADLFRAVREHLADLTAEDVVCLSLVVSFFTPKPE